MKSSKKNYRALIFGVAGLLSCIGSGIVADPMGGIMTGDGELNAAGQMRGKYIQNALDNLKRMIEVQNRSISHTRDVNKKAVDKADDRLKSLQKRVVKIQNKSQ